MNKVKHRHTKLQNNAIPELKRISNAAAQDDYSHFPVKFTSGETITHLPQAARLSLIYPRQRDYHSFTQAERLSLIYPGSETITHLPRQRDYHSFTQAEKLPRQRDDHSFTQAVRLLLIYPGCETITILMPP